MLITLLAQLLLLPPVPETALPPVVSRAFHERFPGVAVSAWEPMHFSGQLAVAAYPQPGTADFDLALFTLGGDLVYQVKAIRNLALAPASIAPALQGLMRQHSGHAFEQVLVITTDAPHCSFFRLDLEGAMIGHGDVTSWFNANGTPAANDSLPISREFFILRVFNIQREHASRLFVHHPSRTPCRFADNCGLTPACSGLAALATDARRYTASGSSVRRV